MNTRLDEVFTLSTLALGKSNDARDEITELLNSHIADESVRKKAFDVLVKLSDANDEYRKWEIERHELMKSAGKTCGRCGKPCMPFEALCEECSEKEFKKEIEHEKV